MLSLKNHPFAVKAFFDSSLVLTLATPREQLQPFIPGCLELDTFQDKWAFVAIAMVQTRGLRPTYFPSFFGNDFFLIGYRIFVRYRSNGGRRLRGLYIIKSETDNRKMEFIGNIFTRYQYATTDIHQETTGNFKTISSERSKFRVTVEHISTDDIQIPAGSPFSDWTEARRFAGPLPHTFSWDEMNKTMLIIRGMRQNWKPHPVKVKTYHFDFLAALKLQNSVLANAFELKDVPYYWEKGRIEKWK